MYKELTYEHNGKIIKRKIKNVMSVSGKGTYKDIESRIINMARSSLKYLLSNNYGILVHRANDYYTISVIALYDNEYTEEVREKKSIKDDFNKFRGFECERLGTTATFTKAYDCILDGSDKRAAEEAWSCFQKISEEYPESHIKLTARRGGSKIEFLI